jgi:integrase
MMLEELERRNYTAGTIRHYLRFVEEFARHFGTSPDKLGFEHLRSYQAYLLKERKLVPGSVENHISALRFFFVRTLHRHEFRQFLPFPRVRKKLPKILSQEEVAQLIDAGGDLFERTLLMVLYGTETFQSRCSTLALPQMRRTHARGAKIHGRRISFHQGTRLVMMPLSIPDHRLASRTPVRSSVQPSTADHPIRHFLLYQALDKRALAYSLTCFHHHRCRCMTQQHLKGSPNNIQYP